MAWLRAPFPSTLVFLVGSASLTLPGALRACNPQEEGRIVYFLMTNVQMNAKAADGNLGL